MARSVRMPNGEPSLRLRTERSLQPVGDSPTGTQDGGGGAGGFEDKLEASSAPFEDAVITPGEKGLLTHRPRSSICRCSTRERIDSEHETGRAKHQ